MKVIQEPLKFKQVLPSTLAIMVLGVVLAVAFAEWAWQGKLGWLAWPLGALLGTVIYALGYLLSCSRWLVTKSMLGLLNNLHTLFQNFTWPQIIIASICAGVGEELLIRGALQTWLVGSTSPLIGIVLASFIFGLMHYMTKTYVLLTFVLGMVFGVAFYLTNSMLLVMIAHTVYDIFAFAMIVKFPHMLGVNSTDGKITTIKETTF